MWHQAAQYQLFLRSSTHKRPARRTLLAILFILVCMCPFRNRAEIHTADLRSARINPANGRLAPDSELAFAIALPLRKRHELELFVRSLYRPGAPQYRNYLTPEEFAREYGPTEADYRDVVRFAEEEGFQIVLTHANRTRLNLRGKVSAIERAFQTTLRTHQHPIENRTYHSPDTEPRPRRPIPFLGVSGLDDFSIPQPASLLREEIRAGRIHPNAYGSDPTGYYIGKDFRKAYAPGVTLDGTGESMALVEFDGYYASDITKYITRANITPVALTNIYLDNFKGTPGTNNLEVALDIDMALSMAPGMSQILVYEGTDPNDVLNAIAIDNLARQISCSWYWRPNATGAAAYVAAMEQILLQYAAQGQSFFTASGDTGAYTGSIPNPSDDPWATSVGATTLTTVTPGGVLASEKVWGMQMPTTNASSGGSSPAYLIPSWQVPISMSQNGGSTSQRNIPDVAIIGNRVVLFANNGVLYGSAGTSVSAPLWAGFAALVNQQSIAAGLGSIGFLNPALYALGLGSNAALAFHDVVAGNNTNMTSGISRYSAVSGYDLCTGWGSPNGAYLINLLSPPVGPTLLNAQTQLAIPLGGIATFQASASGTPPLVYQWSFNGNPLPGATNSALTLSNLQGSQTGSYGVLVTNLYGTASNLNYSLTVILPPVISSDLADVTVPTGQMATFSVGASGTQPLSYIWFRNGTASSATTSSSLTLSNLTLLDSGTQFRCSVSNAAGLATTRTALLTVTNSVTSTSGNSAEVPLLTPGHLLLLGMAMIGMWWTGANRNP